VLKVSLNPNRSINQSILLYADRDRRDSPSVVELAGGQVEEERIKGHEWCLKLTCGTAGDKLVFLSFSSQKECSNWFTKCVKVCIVSALVL